MRRLRIYLDTSVINFLFADDSPDFQRATHEFFDIYSNSYDIFVSPTVLLELSRTPDDNHREALMSVISEHSITILSEDMDDEVLRMAQIYLAEGIVPAKKIEDALHIAYATVHTMDVLLSWNFKHLANVRRETSVIAVNIEQRYFHPLRMVSPLEVENEPD